MKVFGKQLCNAATQADELWSRTSSVFDIAPETQKQIQTGMSRGFGALNAFSKEWEATEGFEQVYGDVI